MAVCRTQVPHPRPRSAPLESEGSGSPPAFRDLAAPSGPIRILRLAEVIDVTGLHKTKIYELQAAGHFPMRVRLTAHSVGWVEQEVQAWLARRVAARSGLSVGPLSPQPLR
ncbi:MAG: helix-turn-helix transcriptional regulator [Steroidobacteraceae bacterium]